MLFIYYYARQCPIKYLSVIFVKKSDLIYNYDKFTYMKPTYIQSSRLCTLYILSTNLYYTLFLNYLNNRRLGCLKVHVI